MSAPLQSRERPSRSAGRQRRFRRSAVVALVVLAVVVLVAELLRPTDAAAPDLDPAVAVVSLDDILTAFNAEQAKRLPVITRIKPAPPDADDWAKVQHKRDQVGL